MLAPERDSPGAVPGQPGQPAAGEGQVSPKPRAAQQRWAGQAWARAGLGPQQQRGMSYVYNAFIKYMTSVNF